MLTFRSSIIASSLFPQSSSLSGKEQAAAEGQQALHHMATSTARLTMQSVVNLACSDRDVDKTSRQAVTSLPRYRNV
jgi:hypothetical protein